MNHTFTNRYKLLSLNVEKLYIPTELIQHKRRVDVLKSFWLKTEDLTTLKDNVRQLISDWRLSCNQAMKKNTVSRTLTAQREHTEYSAKNEFGEVLSITRAYATLNETSSWYMYTIVIVRSSNTGWWHYVIHLGVTIQHRCEHLGTMKTNVFLITLWLSQEDFSSHLVMTHNLTSKSEAVIKWL